LASALSKFYSAFIHSGSQFASNSETEEKILRANQCLGVSFIGTLAETTFDLLTPQTAPALVFDFICLIFLAFAFWLNKNGKNSLAINVNFLSINGLIFVGSILEGNVVGNYLMYIPVLLAGSVLIGLGGKFMQSFFYFGFTILLIVITLLFVPRHSSFQKVPIEQEILCYYVNFALCVIASTTITLVVITLKSQREYTILNEKRFIDAIYNNSINGLIILKEDCNTITDCNKRACELLGINTKQELIGRPFDEWAGQNYVATKRMMTQYENYGQWKGELTLVNHQHQFVADVHLMPFQYNQAKYYKISFIDITAIKQAQAEKERAVEKAIKAAESKSLFLSNISHELRTPLNGIIGTTNLLLQEENGHRFEEQFSILKYSSEHMLSLINDVLDFNKLEADKTILEKNDFNLFTNLQHVAAPFAQQAQQKGIQLEVFVSEKLNKEVTADDTRLNQVLNNLLANAIKFTHQGIVHLSAKLIASSAETMQVMFTVKDTGIGIQADKLNMIFESFTQSESDTTRKYGGTGLGLAISKKIIELFGSQLKVKSTPGQGSEFYFTMSFKNASKQKTFLNDKVVGSLSQLTGRKILVAEDNMVNMMIARKFLQKWGVAITEASDGVQAVQAFEQEKFDLLLFDLEMPNMDGYAALAKIRRQNQQIPAIAFTASVFENMQSFLHSKGFDDYIQKPFRPEDLHKKIAQLIAAHQNIVGGMVQTA
jgi:PAS domain S-box-containing protein